MRKTLALFLFFLCLFSLYSQNQDLLILVESSRAENCLRESNIISGDISFSLKPLLSHSRGNQWFLASPNTRVEMSGWNLAHYVVENNPEVLYAEPDYTEIQTYPQDDPSEKKSSENRGDCKESPYTDDWDHPQQVIFGWHLQDSHSQLRSARQPDSGKKIRIAHFDTGYDPSHISTPKYLCTDLQKNFVEGENPDSAVDPGKGGLLDQPGHGTATLALLAGNRVKRDNYDDYVGAAPFAEVVPVRISKSVILYKSSEFVKALSYIMQPHVKCDVLSMSMGGVASQAWADSVNMAYEKGIVLVTAAGNNIGLKPTSNLVYPARFNRVIAVCGVTYAHTPYSKYGIFSLKMQGNYGPDSVMGSAIAAYTPNTPWALHGCGTKFDMDGAGTSSATPQIAACAALWLQKYQSQAYSYPWQRVNAVRHALFSSAEKGLKDSQKYYGNGVLRAAKAMSVQPKLDSQLIAKDEVRFPIWSILFGKSESHENKMLEVEMCRLEYNNPKIQKIVAQFEQNQTLTEEQKQTLKEAILQMPEASEALKKAWMEIQ